MGAEGGTMGGLGGLPSFPSPPPAAADTLPSSASASRSRRRLISEIGSTRVTLFRSRCPEASYSAFADVDRPKVSLLMASWGLGAYEKQRSV